MIATLTKLELRLIDALSRNELMATLAARRDTVPPEFTGAWLQTQSTDRLRLVLLVARVIAVLRQADNDSQLDPWCGGARGE